MSNHNISPNRKVSKDFSKTPLTRRLGPEPTGSNAIEEVQKNGNQEVEVNRWEGMDTFDEGLRTAMVNWINQTKEGRYAGGLSGSTRTKKIDFQFYGNPSKDIVGQGDIGKFSLVFKYTQRIYQVEPEQVITR